MEFFVRYIQPYIPDRIVRLGLRFLMKNTVNELRNKDWPQKEMRLVERIKQLQSVTFDTDAANVQHYEVPTDFFISHLGKKLKYSSCEWNVDTPTLESAEEKTIAEYQKHLRLDELSAGDVVLEIGNGWGSLCLSNAEKYPNLKFESFSNSVTQISYIQSQIELRGITNLTIWKQDIDEFVKHTERSEMLDELNEINNTLMENILFGRNSGIENNSNVTESRFKRYSRIVSIECIEHCRAYNLLFKKLRSILKDDGFCFFQILGHREYSYLMNDKSWMGRMFFTGGTIPSMHMFSHFNDDLIVSNIKVINGKQYAKTLDMWLNQMYLHKAKIMDILKSEYGSDSNKMYQGWRMFYLMCSESFGYRDGNEWCVGYITMKPR
jgi:cyclopropane-fatty-acyl-phospholipid synthase